MQQKDIPTLEIGAQAISDLPTAKIGELKRGQNQDRKRLELVLQIGIFAISLALTYFIASSLYYDYDFLDFYGQRLKPAILRYWPNFVAVLILVVLGFNLYLFHGYKRPWFGFVEIAFALGLGWYATNKAFSGAIPDAIVIFFAALYLVGRGFANLSSSLRWIQIEPTEKQR